MITIEIWQRKGIWEWAVQDPDQYGEDNDQSAYGSTPDYREACECALITYQRMKNNKPTKENESCSA